MSIGALTVIAVSIVVLTVAARKLNIAYPIVLVLGGVAIGYIPGIPATALPPNLVLVVFLPPLLYWESVTAPTGDFRNSAWWIFQLAFGLVIATMGAVACVAHWIDPSIGWAAAFVLGAVVASTDEVAFAGVADSLHVPRHLIATIEGESLINDATSLILYAVALGAVVGEAFSLGHAAVELAVSVVAAIAIGIAAGVVIVGAWRIANDDEVQPFISLCAPYLAYLPALHFHVSGVLATVVAGLFVNRYSPRALTPHARQRATGFFVTIVFVLNAFIFVSVGMQFHSILAGLARYSGWELVRDAAVVCVTVIAVRCAWVFMQALLPSTNLPEHTSGKADWPHVTILAWAGMRGGVSLAAALAIPIVTAAGPFRERGIIIFLTFAVLLATLVIQGGSLPWLVRALHVRDDGADDREERLALSRTAKIALKKLETIRSSRDVPNSVADALERRFHVRWREFTDGSQRIDPKLPDLYRQLERELVTAQRDELVRLRDTGAIDNTVMRRIQALLDHEDAENDLLRTSGHTDIDPED